ncbi:MAG: hypothetical protein OXU20_21040 [Myxococcales bacterium]|nr:hypothetical protein [Myxococcales bacterium]
MECAGTSGDAGWFKRLGAVLLPVLGTALGSIGGYWIGQQERIEEVRIKHVDEFVQAAQTVWQALDSYEAKLSHEAHQMEVDLVLGAHKFKQLEAGYRLEQRTETESQRAWEAIRGARSVLGEEISRMLMQRTGILAHRWRTWVDSCASCDDFRSSGEIIDYYDAHLRASRFDLVQAREYALQRLGY